MALRRLLGRVPITVKVPVVVASLMAGVGIVASESVLSRLAAIQERHVADLTAAYLDGLASPLVDPVLRADPWEIFDVLDQARQLSAAVRPVETIVTDADGLVLAGSDPRNAPVGSVLPAEHRIAREQVSEGVIRQDSALAFVDRALVVEGRTVGALHAEFDVSPLLADRRRVLWTLLLTNAALTLAMMLLGWFAVRGMVKPMKVLSDHLERSHEGIAPIPEERLPNPDSEAGRLLRRFNGMAVAIAENAALAARLAEEERLGSLGRLATGMAHEINNPLGGLFNAIDTLKKHGDKPMVRASSLSLVERGLCGIRDVVQATLATYREKNGTRPLSAHDFDDVRLLLGPELRRRAQALDWDVDADPLPALPGNAVRQTAINLLLNASAASGQGGRIAFRVRTDPGHGLSIVIGDSGPGLPPEAAAALTGAPTAAPVGSGKGLGLWIVRRSVEDSGGTIEVGASPLGGAEIRLRYAAPVMEVRTDAA